MSNDELLVQLGMTIYNKQNEIDIKKQLVNLENEKGIKEKNILLKLREIELLQTFIFNNEYSGINLISYINNIAKNELVENSYSENDDNIDNENRKIYFNIKYFLCEYLYEEDSEYIKNLQDKVNYAYIFNNKKLLKFYELLSEDIFSRNLKNGRITKEKLESSIVKIEQENNTALNNENILLKGVSNDIDKLNKLIEEIDQIMLMSMPKTINDYII